MVLCVLVLTTNCGSANVKGTKLKCIFLNGSCKMPVETECPSDSVQVMLQVSHNVCCVMHLRLQCKDAGMLVLLVRMEPGVFWLLNSLFSFPPRCTVFLPSFPVGYHSCHLQLHTAQQSLPCGFWGCFGVLLMVCSFHSQMAKFSFPVYEMFIVELMLVPVCISSLSHIPAAEPNSPIQHSISLCPR